MIKIKTKEGNTGIKTKGNDAELLAEMVFLMASIGEASRELIDKVPEGMHTGLKADQIKAFVKTLNGESCEEAIKEVLHNSVGRIL